jgi:hypothetical protein
MNALNKDFTRTEEALLAAAGLDASHPQHADFRLTKGENGQWEISSLSLRGYDWICAGMNEALRTGTETSVAINLFEANRFLKAAKAKGFATEYVGLSGVDYV